MSLWVNDLLTKYIILGYTNRTYNEILMRVNNLFTYLSAKHIMVIEGVVIVDINQVGSNVLFYLKEQNMTQVDLATGLGASKQVVNKIIKGKKAIKTEELVAISNFLDVSVEELINGKNSVEETGLEAVHLYGKIENHDTADFILSLVSNLSTMEEELAAHGLLK